MLKTTVGIENTLNGHQMKTNDKEHKIIINTAERTLKRFLFYNKYLKENFFSKRIYTHMFCF